MTKSELRTGMIVTARNGNRYMVFLNTTISSYRGSDDFLVGLKGDGFNYLSNYNENLTCKAYNSFDIMKVEKCKWVADLTSKNPELNTIWERKEKKTYTYAQLREILGSEFEVVG
jgi:hypothetical protein